MISEKNIIFSDIHGFHGSDISRSEKRGDWDNTKALINKGADWIINEVKNSELRGRRRRSRLSNRFKMVIYAQEKKQTSLYRN